VAAAARVAALRASVAALRAAAAAAAAASRAAAAAHDAEAARLAEAQAELATAHAQLGAAVGVPVAVGAPAAADAGAVQAPPPPSASGAPAADAAAGATAALAQAADAAAVPVPPRLAAAATHAEDFVPLGGEHLRLSGGVGRGGGHGGGLFDRGGLVNGGLAGRRRARSEVDDGAAALDGAVRGGEHGAPLPSTVVNTLVPAALSWNGDGYCVVDLKAGALPASFSDIARGSFRADHAIFQVVDVKKAAHKSTHSGDETRFQRPACELLDNDGNRWACTALDSLAGSLGLSLDKESLVVLFSKAGGARQAAHTDLPTPREVSVSLSECVFWSIPWAIARTGTSTTPP
jgi:hypothetical protein